jgi:hypothetical protein
MLHLKANDSLPTIIIIITLLSVQIFIITETKSMRTGLSEGMFNKICTCIN